MSIDKGNYSPNYAIGLIHGAYAATYPPRGGSHYHQPYAHMWTYRRGFARGYRLARGLQPIPRPQKPREHDRSSGRMCWCWQTHERAAQAASAPGAGT